MNQILVTVDGSKHSERVVDEAITVAKYMGAKLLLLYVCPDFLTVPEEFAEYAKDEDLGLADYYSVASNNILSKFGSRIKEEGIEFEAISEVGRASDEILDVAKTRSVNMIVVGMHGLHAVDRFRSLGSTARRVVEQSPIPVIVVP